VSSELDGKDNKGFEDKEKDKNSTTVSHWKFLFLVLILTWK
jgi:hypothetical protein